MVGSCQTTSTEPRRPVGVGAPTPVDVARRASRASSWPRPPWGTSGAPRATTTTGATRPSSWPATRPFEDIWYLLLEGRLPDAAESRRFTERVARARTVPAALLERVAAATADAATVLDGLRTAALHRWPRPSPSSPCSTSPRPPAAADAVDLAAVVPVLVATVHRARTGRPPVASRSDLGHAADLLWTVTGEEPPTSAVRALDRYLGPDRRPRVQRLHLHREGRGLHRSRPRCLCHRGASGPSRDRSTAAPRAGPSSCSTSSASPSGPRRSCVGCSGGASG